MGNANQPTTPEGNATQSTRPEDYDESRLRDTDLEGSESKEAVDHEDYLKKRNPDTQVRLDGEKDDLYSDGLDIDESSGPLAGTSTGGTAGAKG